MPRKAPAPDPPATPDTISAALSAAENGDVEKLRDVLASSVVWHTPPHNLTGGDHLGREQSLVLLREYQRLSGGTLRVDVAKSDASSVTLHATAARPGHGRLDVDETIRFRIEDGKVTELWTQPRDVDAWDRFWAP